MLLPVKKSHQFIFTISKKTKIMKKTIGLIFLPLFILLILGGCKKDSNNQPTPSADPISTVVSSGIWSVSSYTQRTENKTSMFTGISFVFSSDGKISATGTSSANGTWISTPATAGYYGGPASLATFNISLGTSDPFSRISKSWNVAQQTATLLQLDNREPAEDEHLIFIKK
jgi:hypothetical protein